LNLESAEFKNLEKRILENLKIDLNIDSLSDDFKKTIKDYLSKSFTADIRYAIQQEVRSQLSEKGIDDSIIEDIRSETTNEDLKELIEAQNKEITTLKAEVKALKPVQSTTKQNNDNKEIKNINEKLEKFMYGGIGRLALNVVLLLTVMFKK
jgi:predicted RND superfamily exporter protein